MPQTPPRPRGQERGAGRGTMVWKGSRQQAVIGTSLGGSLFSEWTHPFTGEPIPRSSATSLGGSLFSDWTNPFTGGPIARSSTSFRRTRWQDLTSVVGLGISQGASPVVGVGVLYSNTTFIRETTPLLQIRQVARLMEHDMQVMQPAY